MGPSASAGTPPAHGDPLLRPRTRSTTLAVRSRLSLRVDIHMLKHTPTFNISCLGIPASRLYCEPRSLGGEEEGAGRGALMATLLHPRTFTIISTQSWLRPSPASRTHSQPMSMTQMEKIFSELVLGETLPKPTLVRLLNVK